MVKNGNFAPNGERNSTGPNHENNPLIETTDLTLAQGILYRSISPPKIGRSSTLRNSLGRVRAMPQSSPYAPKSESRTRDFDSVTEGSSEPSWVEGIF